MLTPEILLCAVWSCKLSYLRAIIIIVRTAID